MKKSLLSSVKSKLLKNLFEWFQLGFDFYIYVYLWISLASFVVIADGKHVFFVDNQHGSLSS